MLMLGRKLRGALGRIFPGCVTMGQAVAFNMFLAFFPMLLLALGILSGSAVFRGAVAELPEKVRLILPPGSEQVILDYLLRRGVHPERWIALGLGGTLIAGTQVMIGFMQGFRIINGEEKHTSYLRLQLRALLLLLVTLGPWLIVVVLTVFGRPGRAWLIRRIGVPQLVTDVANVASLLLVLGLAVAVLVLMYRVGRPGHHGWRDLLPGAEVATIFWWVVDMLLGLYVKRVPYGVVYGGLAAAIGLLLWMYMSAMVIFLGAAYNAEAAAISMAPCKPRLMTDSPQALSSERKG
jgi:membrane protein